MKGNSSDLHPTIKGLYGTLQATLLFWHKLRSFLMDQLGFIPNPYDQCVVNKIIHGKQCTVGWHVDDIMVSHVNKAVVEGIISQFNSEYGNKHLLQSPGA